jgi:hypothetical protein
VVVNVSALFNALFVDGLQVWSERPRSNMAILDSGGILHQRRGLVGNECRGIADVFHPGLPICGEAADIHPYCQEMTEDIDVNDEHPLLLQELPPPLTKR